MFKLQRSGKRNLMCLLCGYRKKRGWFFAKVYKNMQDQLEAPLSQPQQPPLQLEHIEEDAQPLQPHYEQMIALPFQDFDDIQFNPDHYLL
jgi:hypothetical protein